MVFLFCVILWVMMNIKNDSNFLFLLSKIKIQLYSFCNHKSSMGNCASLGYEGKLIEMSEKGCTDIAVKFGDYEERFIIEFSRKE